MYIGLGRFPGFLTTNLQNHRHERELKAVAAETCRYRLCKMSHIGTHNNYPVEPIRCFNCSKPKIWPVLKITWEFNITLWCLWCPHYGVFSGTLSGTSVLQWHALGEHTPKENNFSSQASGIKWREGRLVSFLHEWEYPTQSSNQ